MATVTAYLNGLSAILLCAWGFMNFFRFFLLYFKEKKKLQPIVAILGLSLGSFFLGPTVTFFSLMFTGENIPVITYGYLSYSLQPIAIIAAMYLGFEIFNKEKQKMVVGIFAVAGVGFWIAFYGWSELMILPVETAEGELLDISLGSIVMVITAINLLCLPVFLSTGFYRLRKRISDPQQRRKALFLGRGWIIFTLAGFMDTLIFSELLPDWIIIPRLFMMACYYNIFMGFAPLRKD